MMVFIRGSVTYLMQKFLSIIFLLIFFICGCGGPVQQNIATAKIPAQTVSQPPSGKEPYGKNLYRNKENHFSIIFPEGWEQSGGRGPNVVVVSKNKTGESINIIVKELPDQFRKYTFENFSQQDVNDFVAINIQDTKKGYPDTSFDGSGTAYVNNCKAIWIKTTQTYKNSTNSFQLTSIIYFIWKNGKQYTISCFAPPEKFAKYENIFISSIGSFVLEEGWY